VVIKGRQPKQNSINVRSSPAWLRQPSSRIQ
jgi:hypothetical protein